MNLGFRALTVLAAAMGLTGSIMAWRAGAQEQPPSPRPGLTAQQAKQAVELARGAMQELRKKTEGASEPDADRREYVVNVELLARKEDEPPASGESSKIKSKSTAKSPAPRAVVTSYRYFDDITFYATVDLSTGRVVDVQAAQHIPTPLSDSEFDEAVAAAREKSDEVKKLYEAYGEQLKVYPQFSQFTVKDDPRVHRVVYLNYRLGKHDLSYPRPQVDLTAREVRTPDPEPDPDRPRRKREGGRSEVGHGFDIRKFPAPRAPFEEEKSVSVVALSARLARAVVVPAFRAVRFLALWYVAIGAPTASAQPFFRRPVVVDPPSQEVTVEFPFSESGGIEPRKGTAWKVHYARGLHKGLYVTGAWFKRDLGEDWIKILNDARVSELFVPYHQHSYVRFLDLTSFSFPMAEVKAEDAGPFGTLMPPFQGDTYSTVVKEVRDRGIAWKDYAHGVRRGRELVLWGALEAGNYMYLMSYSFFDDGTIAFRVGATGQNLPGQRYEAHVHSAHWRIDIDLFDGRKNSAMLMKHVEDPASLAAEDVKEPFNGGMEGGVDWDPKQFTMIRVESDKKNARGQTIAYDLMPLRYGTPRHREPFTHHDLWVSRSHSDRPLEYLFVNLPNIVKDEEIIEQTDIILWCNSAVHHEPRNEDGMPGAGRRYWPGDDAWAGSAPVMWSGMDLRPRNMFDRTPFYPYPPPPPPRQAGAPGSRPSDEGGDPPVAAPAEATPNPSVPDQRK